MQAVAVGRSDTVGQVVDGIVVVALIQGVLVCDVPLIGSPFLVERRLYACQGRRSDGVLEVLHRFTLVDQLLSGLQDGVARQ